MIVVYGISNILIVAASTAFIVVAFIIRSCGGSGRFFLPFVVGDCCLLLWSEPSRVDDDGCVDHAKTPNSGAS